MIPVKQKYFHDPDNNIYGDCHRAAIASILELDIDDVPHFGDGGPEGEEFNNRVNKWVKDKNLLIFHTAYGGELDNIFKFMKCVNPDIYYILGGTSNNNVEHSVVGFRDSIIHDPAIDNSGIIGPCKDGFYWISVIGYKNGNK